MSEATPGPWVVEPRSFSPSFFVRRESAGSDEAAIAIVNGRDDATLIAAAPDLVEALQGLRSFVAVMVGYGPNARIPETIETPLGAPVKIGEMMRDAKAALTKAGVQS